MRRIPAVLAVVFAAGLASAQMKAPQQQAPTATPAPAIESQQAVAAREVPLESARRIQRDEAIKLVKAGKAVFVDVRPRAQYDEGHIKGAVSFPLSELPAHMKELPTKKMIITYCA
jgi:3-mercaptopyruvate sulfurtransferase SseA